MSHHRTVWSNGWHNTGSLTVDLLIGLIASTQFVWWCDGDLLRLGALSRATTEITQRRSRRALFRLTKST